jgi:hypothetical protein
LSVGFPSPLGRGQGEGNGFVERKLFPHPPLWGTFPQEGKENPDFPRTAVFPHGVSFYLEHERERELQRAEEIPYSLCENGSGFRKIQWAKTIDATLLPNFK